MKTWVDPPSGYLFGFPKIWDDTIMPDLNDWLIAEGYPQEEINRYGENFFCRFWDASNERTASK